MTCDNVTVGKGQSARHCKVSREGHDPHVPGRAGCMCARCVPVSCEAGLVFKHDISPSFPHLGVNVQRTVQIFV